MKKLDSSIYKQRLLVKNITTDEEITHKSHYYNLKCLVCDYEWNGRPHNYMYKNACPNCSGKVKHDNGFVDKFLKDNNKPFMRIGDVVNSSTLVKFKCLLDEFEWDVRTSDILQNKCGCPRCAKRERLTNEIIDERFKNTNFKRLSECGNNNKHKILVGCLVCDYKWNTAPSDIFYKVLCPMCNKKARTTIDIIDKRLEGRNIKRNFDKVPVMKDKVSWRCVVDGNLWDATVNAILNNKTGCPECKNKNEKELKEFILKNIDLDLFVHQKLFKFNNRKYYVDFYFEVSGKKYIVKYNGIQHYKVIEHWGGQQSLEKQQKRDEELRIFCQEKNYILIEIPYNVDKFSYLLENL